MFPYSKLSLDDASTPLEVSGNWQSKETPLAPLMVVTAPGRAHSLLHVGLSQSVGSSWPVAVASRADRSITHTEIWLGKRLFHLNI